MKILRGRLIGIAIAGLMLSNLGLSSARADVIGTGGKGAIAIRFDDYQYIFNKDVYPLMLERGLPASMALISEFSTAHWWGKGSTWNDVRKWNRNGIEIWSHGTDHNDYTLKENDCLYDQIVRSKLDIEKQNIKVVGWAMPGVNVSPREPLYGGLTKPSDYDGEAGILIKKTYSLSEGYAYKPQRELPSTVFHGANHITISDGDSLEKTIASIDYAIDNKTGLELMCHSGSLGKPGRLSMKDFIYIIDYIKGKWDANLVEVLTPSGLAYANPNKSNRDRITLTSKYINAWKNKGNANSRIEKEKVKDKNREFFMRVKSSSHNTGIRQVINTSDKLEVAGEQFTFEAWVRTNGKRECYIRIPELGISKIIPLTNGWKKVRFSFGITKSLKSITVNLLSNKGSIIDWDDIIIKKI